MNLREIIQALWACEVCGRIPDVPEGIENMPALRRHIVQEGWQIIEVKGAKGRLFRCPDHRMSLEELDTVEFGTAV